MFEKQPVKNASVFLMRYITHNWSDKYCRILLRQLREVASPSTRIIAIDHIQDHQCRSNELAKIVPGAYKPPAPEPLLPYPESATGLGYLLDMQVCTSFLIQSAMLIRRATDDGHVELPGTDRPGFHRIVRVSWMEVGKNPSLRLSVAPRTRLLTHTLNGCSVQGQAVSPCFVACCFRRTSDFGRRFAWFHVLRILLCVFSCFAQPLLYDI